MGARVKHELLAVRDGCSGVAHDATVGAVREAHRSADERGRREAFRGLGANVGRIFRVPRVAWPKFGVASPIGSATAVSEPIANGSRWGPSCWGAALLPVAAAGAPG